MKGAWSARAAGDLKAAYQYIAMDNPSAAKRIVETISKAVHELLTAFPESGRFGRIEGTRELVVPNTPFLVPYRINGDVVEILGVHNGSRRWPDSF